MITAALKQRLPNYIAPKLYCPKTTSPQNYIARSHRVAKRLRRSCRLCSRPSASRPPKRMGFDIGWYLPSWQTVLITSFLF